MPRPIKRHPLILHRSLPATTPGTKPDLNASFVSANAEQFYQYQPTEIILSEGRLVDSQGMVLLVSTITPIPAVV